MTDKKKDDFGDFLAKYDEYLDGRRSYSDLPVLRACEPRSPFRADSADVPAPASKPPVDK